MRADEKSWMTDRRQATREEESLPASSDEAFR